MDTEVSNCGTYLYSRRATQSDGVGTLMFVLRHPTLALPADAEQICATYRDRWGYEELLITYLYGLRTDSVEDLARARDPVGPRTNIVLRRCAERSHRIVLAWGPHPAVAERAQCVIDMLGVWPLFHLENAPVRPRLCPPGTQPKRYSHLLGVA